VACEVLLADEAGAVTAEAVADALGVSVAEVRKLFPSDAALVAAVTRYAAAFANATDL
jgi:AcrR family transcriptional regulator